MTRRRDLDEQSGREQEHKMTRAGAVQRSNGGPGRGGARDMEGEPVQEQRKGREGWKQQPSYVVLNSYCGI